MQEPADRISLIAAAAELFSKAPRVSAPRSVKSFRVSAPDCDQRLWQCAPEQPRVSAHLSARLQTMTRTSGKGGGKKPKSTRTHSKQMFKFSHGIDCKTAYHLWCRRVALTDISRRCHDNHRRMNHLSPSPYMRDVYQAFLLSVFNRFLSVCKKKMPVGYL